MPRKKILPETVTLTCSECGKTFERESSRIRRKDHFFCTPQCRDKWHTRHKRVIAGWDDDRTEEIMGIAKSIARIGHERELNNKLFESLLSLIEQEALMAFRYGAKEENKT